MTTLGRELGEKIRDLGVTFGWAAERESDLESHTRLMAETLRDKFSVQMERGNETVEAYAERVLNAFQAASRLSGQVEDVADVVEQDFVPAIQQANEDTQRTIALLDELKEIYPSTYEVGLAIQATARSTTAAMVDATGDLAVGLIDAKGAFEGIKAPVEQYSFEIDGVLAASQAARDGVERHVGEQAVEWAKAQGAAETAATGMEDAFKQFRDSAGNIFDDIFIKGENVFDSLASTISGIIQTLARTIFQNLSASVLGGLTGRIPDIGGILNFGGGVASGAGGAAGAAGGGASAAGSGFSLAGGLFSAAGGALGGLVSGLMSRNFQGVVSGTLGEIRDLLNHHMPDIEKEIDFIPAINDRLNDINDNSKFLPTISATNMTMVPQLEAANSGLAGVREAIFDMRGMLQEAISRPAPVVNINMDADLRALVSDIRRVEESNTDGLGEVSNLSILGPERSFAGQ